MSRHMELQGRQFWIISEPHEDRWKAFVQEAHADGFNEPVGIEAIADTRVAADDAAERKLRRLLGAY
jgi:hypothetical protein